MFGGNSKRHGLRSTDLGSFAYEDYRDVSMRNERLLKKRDRKKNKKGATATYPRPRSSWSSQEDKGRHRSSSTSRKFSKKEKEEWGKRHDIVSASYEGIISLFNLFQDQVDSGPKFSYSVRHRESLPKPGTGTKMMTWKQKLFHGDSTEDPELRQRFERMDHLRKRLIVAQKKLKEEVRQACSLLEIVTTYTNHRSDDGMAHAVKQLKRTIKRCGDCSHHKEALHIIERILDDRKTLRFYKISWDRFIRKTSRLEAEARNAREPLSHRKRTRLDECKRVQKKYDEFAEDLSAAMDRLEKECVVDLPLLDDLKTDSFSLLLSFKKMLRAQSKKDDKAKQIYKKCWNQFNKSMASV